MRKDIIRHWAAVLRSGKYEQGTGRLKWGNKFCCLGVLCDMGDEGAWKGASYLREEYLLPPKIREYVGISNALVMKLATMNDAGISFADIADCLDGLCESGS